MATKQDTNGNPSELSPLPVGSKRFFSPQDDWTLLSQGAEARVWKVPNFAIGDNTAAGSLTTTTTTTTVICKERFAKKYRHPVLDARLTKQRSRMEARLLGKCQAKGIHVPSVLHVDSNFSNSTALIYLELIDGQTVRDYLEENLLPRFEPNGDSDEVNGDRMNDKIVLNQLANEIGVILARLHSSGMVHGDLTTSNMMLKTEATYAVSSQSPEHPIQPKIILIDFGLAKNTTAAEERAVDLYVLERALQSTHPTLPKSFLEILLAAYASGGIDESQNETASVSLTKGPKHDTMIRLEKVRQRGRKRECFG
jgi:TP53 regulating kinase and related kinases